MAQSLKFGSTDPNKVLGSVFGTFGVQYKPEEFERVREDGFTVIGMVPDCRVFIYGAEVTKDVIDVTVNNSIEGNTCDITLTNPRGRYEITKQDLMGKWREDKDILAAYDYSQFNRVTPGMFDNFMDKITTTAFGKKAATNIKKGMNIAKSVNALLGGSGGAPKVRGVTRQIFETKYFSGISKYNGDIVFDYKDPVYVFFKGRFAPLWYFGFSGIVVGWDDNDTYEQTYSIKLKCEDITALWKRSKLTLRGAMFAFSRGEDRIRSNNTGQTYNPTDLVASLSFSDLVKMAVYSYNYGKFVYNCHESSPGPHPPPSTPADAEIASAAAGGSNYTSTSAYKDKIKKLQEEAFIDGGVATVGGAGARYMFTRSKGGWGIGVNGKASYDGSTKDLSGKAGTINDAKNAGLIPIAEIKYLQKELFKSAKPYQLNESPLGPSAAIYLQQNEIEFPDKIPFTGENLQAMLNISVRYWEAGHTIPSTVSSDASNITGTGWKDNKAFGIAGIHPALTYDFINNFNILDGIWQQCYISKKSVDRVIMTPNDKIRSTVGGMPTELVPDTDLAKAKSEPIGTAVNFFRPRLFVVLPRRFSDRYKKTGEGDFAKFENLFKESATSVYEFLKEKAKGIEYIMYSSPCGDIFIEPELYDFHPLEFSQKIEQKSIITKEIPVKVRAYSGEQNLPATRQDKAYMFNSFANHPFFIMEKDRLRTTQTFNHQLIHTEVSVRGGIIPGGGVLDVLDDRSREAITAIASASMGRGYNLDTAFANGVYVADGFQKNFGSSSVVYVAKSTYEKLRFIMDKTVFTDLFQFNATRLIKNIAMEYGTYMSRLKKEDATYPLFKEESERIQKIIKSTSGNDPGMTATEEDAMSILINEFPNLLSTFDKPLKDVIKEEFNRYKTESKKEFTKVTGKSVLMEKLKVEGATYEAVLRILDESSYNSKDETFALVREIIRIGTPISLIKDATKAAADKVIVALVDYNKKGGSTLLIRNIAEEKVAAQLGIYDPRYDMVKHYGYNPKGELKNSFIKNGIEAYNYARTVFNRLKGKAFQISMEVIGRPEFMLNRPYYCERKDSIGLLTKYSVRYQIGSSFLSSATLEYVRKNSITYDYSLGDLDPFKGSANNNYFKTQAEMYYKLNRFATNFAGRTTDAITGAAAGNNPGFGRALGAKIAGNVASSVMGSLLPAGGVFSMHDRIGHIPFDTRFSDKTLSVSKIGSLPVTSGSNEDNTIKNAPFGTLYNYCKSIFDTLAERTNNEKIKEQWNKTNIANVATIKKIEDRLLAITKELIALQAQPAPDLEKRIAKEIKHNTLVKERLTLNTELNKMYSEGSANFENYKTAIRAIDTSNLALYGIATPPANINNIVHATYTYIKNNNTKPVANSDKYKEGLFYKLFDTYMDIGVGKIPAMWIVDEKSKKTVDIQGFSNVVFYLTQSSKQG